MPVRCRHGQLQAQWPVLDTGEADSPIVGSETFSGPARVAVAPGWPRFAVTDGGHRRGWLAGQAVTALTVNHLLLINR